RPAARARRRARSRGRRARVSWVGLMIVLYDAERCPYCARVRIALAEKGLEHEVVVVDLADRPAWLYEKNPLGKVPGPEEEGPRVWARGHRVRALADPRAGDARRRPRSLPVARRVARPARRASGDRGRARARRGARVSDLPAVVDAAWLAEHLGEDDLVVGDVRGPNAHARGHIPGSRPLVLGSPMPMSDTGSARAVRDEIARRLDDPTLAVVDVRTEPEYTGKSGNACDPRQGHIPGARRVEVGTLFAGPGEPLPPERIRELVGLPDGAEIVAYCH